MVVNEHSVMTIQSQSFFNAAIPFKAQKECTRF